MPAGEVAAIARRLGAPVVEEVPDAAQAVARARTLGDPLVFGSIFLVGAVRSALLGETVDPLIVQDPRAGAPRP
jgi:hypothetical protein